jgi:hypothetical protein
MTTDEWLEHALRDAERRGLPALRPILEGLARSTAALRAADWNLDMSRESSEASSENAR